MVLAWISARMQPGIEAQVVELTKASKLAKNAFSAIDTVKCFNGQDFELRQYARAIKKAAKHYLVQAQANALQIGFVRLVTLAMFVQGFWYGSHLVNTGQKNPGEVLTAFWACLMATQSVEQILPQIIVLEKGKAAGATLQAIMLQMESGRKVMKMIGKTAISFCEGDIEVRNVSGRSPTFAIVFADLNQVSFSYPSRPDHLALNKATFFFPAGETTFVVGRSGSGKSTLGNLLMHFYSPGSGELMIDGNSIQTLDINWLRNNITLVQQQSVLFNETIFKNIAFGTRDYSRVRKEEVKRCIETAVLQHTISDLPQGLDTIVGTGGNAMSGGQKQRVAIARARLRDTPILILDESTNALDHMSKTLVTDAIRKWRQGKTTIIITHDMSQVRENDYAYVMDKGVVVQEGFRHVLERSVVGPFNRPLESPPDIIPLMQQKTSPPERCPSDASGSTNSTPESIASDDSMDIHVRPRRHFIPTVFGPLEDSHLWRTSQGPISPLTPMDLPGHPGPTAAPMSNLQQGNESYPMQTVGSVRHEYFPILSLPDREDAAPGLSKPAPSKMPSEKSPQSTLPPAHSRVLSNASCPMEELPKRKRNLPKAEKARRNAPLQKILLTIWPTLTWKKRFILILGFFCAAIHAAATPAFSFVFAKLLATLYLPSLIERSHMALIWSLSVLGVAIIDGGASYFTHYLLESCGQEWIDTLRVEAMKRILDQPRSWFDRDKNSLTRLTECLDRNAEEMRNLLGRFAGFVFVAFITMSLALIWSLIISWKLTLVGVASGPFIYAVTRSFDFVSRKWEGKSNDAGEAANAVFSETFGNIRTVRALTLEDYFHKKYSHAINHALKVGLKRSAYSGLFFGLSDSGIIFVTALMFYYGARLASSQANSVADILTVLTMLLFSIANVNAIMALLPQINSSRSTASRLLRLSHLSYKVSHEHSGTIRLITPGPISFTATTFTYPSRPLIPILRSLTLPLPPSTSTALVGASGSGKSTLASLLLSLYPPSSGLLTLNNHPISTLHTPTLRSLISIVPQSPTLFPTTISANIAYALPAHSPLATAFSIRAAARAAGIDDFITSLPQGYNTLIGEGGTGLSGGQAQRIAIARAVVRRPRLLILDEATSGLDGETARTVKHLVRGLEGNGVGVLVITHERGMMEVCAEVVVVGGGGIVERGRFEELLGRRGGELRRLLGGEG